MCNIVVVKRTQEKNERERKENEHGEKQFLHVCIDIELLIEMKKERRKKVQIHTK